MKIDESVLKDMKKAAVMSGRLSELHVKNIQMYPFVFFDNVTHVDIDYNIDMSQESSQSYMNFSLKMKKKPKNILNLDKRMQALRSSIETLLWSGIKISVSINGQDVEDV